jgi:hypothetical protein
MTAKDSHVTIICDFYVQYGVRYYVRNLRFSLSLSLCPQFYLKALTLEREEVSFVSPR